MTKLSLSNFKNNTRLKLVYISTAIIALIAHGYFYFNSINMYDNVIFYKDDFLWQIKIGRFLQFFIPYVRGFYSPPLLVGTLQMLYTSIATYLLVVLFDIKDKIKIILISAILITCNFYTILNAGFTLWSDIFSFAYLMAVLAVYILRRSKYWYFAILCIIIFMALYQAFIDDFIFTVMAIILIDTIGNKDFKKLLIDTLKAILVVLVGVGIYYLLANIIASLNGVALLSEYNGASSSLSYGINDTFKYLFISYKYFLSKMFVLPLGINTNIIALINIVIFSMAFISYIVIIKQNKLKLSNLIYAILIALLMPLGINAICFISKGTSHELMTHSFSLSYVLIFALVFKLWKQTPIKLSLFIKNTTIIFASLLISLNVFYSNQVYYISKQRSDNVNMMMSDVVSQILNYPDYIHGETAVVIVVDNIRPNGISDNPYFNDNTIGIFNHGLVNFRKSYDYYINRVMSIDLKLLDMDIVNGKHFANDAGEKVYNELLYDFEFASYQEYLQTISDQFGRYDMYRYYVKNDEQLNIIKNLKTWPSRDNIVMLNGILFIKIS